MSRGRVVVVGGGPGGMAAALAAHRLGFEVRIFERHREAKPGGNILNLWPPPEEALQLLGVDTDELGAPVHSVLANHRGRVRADVRLPDEVVAQYGGGFIGLLRAGLYERCFGRCRRACCRWITTATGGYDPPTWSKGRSPDSAGGATYA